MSTGLKANVDGSAAIQVGGVDAITLTSAGAASFVTSPMTIQGGSAAAPSLTFSGDTNTGIFSPAADTIAFSEGGVESMRIDSAGNVGIGTTTPTNYGKLAVSGDIGAFVPTAGVLNGTRSIYIGPGSEYTSASAPYVRATVTNSSTLATALSFGVYSGSAQNEAMRIDSSGNLLVGTTSTPSSSNPGVRIAQPGSNLWISYNSGTASYTQFIFGNANGQVGSISTSGSGTSFTTTSDYRLKEDVQPMTGALAKVAALKPVTYKWKASGEASEGFIAHELQAVCPDAVIGEKDAVNEDGSIKPQGIDTSFLVATLTAAIKEQQQMIETLQAEVALLKGAA